jgi:hypothetical protein
MALAALSAVVALGFTGCHARSSAPAISAVPARSLTTPSSAVSQVRSSPLYRQARQDCTRHDYRKAADRLQTLARTPGLTPDALAFCNTQRDICLKDAGLLPAAAPVSSPSAILPASDADCGPRALLLVCQRLGVKTTLPRLRQAAATTQKGTTLAGLQQAAQKVGLQAEGVQVNRQALPNTALPAIAWVNRNHYVALLALSGSGDTATATIHDPNKPTQEILSQEQLLQRCGGFLLLLRR